MAADRRDANRGQDQDDYDPVAHRDMGQPLTSDFAALMHLFKGSIGNGILFLPNGYRRCGLVMPIICGFCIGILCIHTVTTLVKCSQILCKRNRVPMLDLAATARNSFLSGPEQVHKYSRAFGIVINVIIIFVHMQAGVIYILYISTSLQQVIEFFSGVELDVRVYLVALFPIYLILGFIPHLKYLAPFSIAGSCFMFAGLCVSMYYFLEDLPDPGRLRPFTAVLPVPMYCTIFLFALHNVTLCMPLENTMETPHHLPGLITFNMFFNTCLYTTFGFLGYNKYFDHTCDTVIKNLPIEQPLAQAVKIAISFAVLCTLGIGYYVPIRVLWPLILEKWEIPHEWERIAEYTLRFSGLALFTIIAIAIPQLVPLLGLFTAISTTSIMLLIPVLIETTTKWQDASRFLLTKNCIISVIWLILLICGVTQSLIYIVKEYGAEKEEGC